MTFSLNGTNAGGALILLLLLVSCGGDEQLPVADMEDYSRPEFTVDDPTMLIKNLGKEKERIENELKEVTDDPSKHLQSFESNAQNNKAVIASALKAIDAVIFEQENRMTDIAPQSAQQPSGQQQIVKNHYQQLRELKQYQVDFQRYDTIFCSTQLQYLIIKHKSEQDKIASQQEHRLIYIWIILSNIFVLVIVLVFLLLFVFGEKKRKKYEDSFHSAPSINSKDIVRKPDTKPAQENGENGQTQRTQEVGNQNKDENHTFPRPIPSGDLFTNRRSPEEELISLYNRCVQGDQEADKREFLKRHKPIRIAVLNSQQRIKNSDEEARFGPGGDGDFMAITKSVNEYWIVPRFDLSINDANFGSGAIGNVFDCSGHKPGESFDNYTVIKPAIFTSSPGSSDYKLKQKGSLLL